MIPSIEDDPAPRPPVSRRAAALAAALALLVGACAERAPERPAHVLLIVVDTLRADHVGALGDWAPRGIGPSPTPAIDALARRGAVFERAYAQSSWTAPSMVSLMTGRRVAGDRLAVPFAEQADPTSGAPALGDHALPGPARIPTIATSFRARGWSTAAFICNDIVSAENGYRGGFDVFEQHTPYVGFLEPIADWFARHAHEHTFTYVHLNEPHDPYRPPSGVSYPDEWEKLWQQSPPSISDERRRYYEVQRERFGLPPIEGDVTEIELESARYIDDVRFADDRIQRMLTALEEAGMLERTLVVLTADHGEGLWTRPAFASGDRGREQLKDRKPAAAQGRHPAVEPMTLWNTLKVTHGNQVYPELTRVPLILAGPGVRAGRFDLVVENVDIWPTLLELCDFEVPARLDGRSLLTLTENSSAWRSAKPVGFSATRYNVTVLDQDGWQLVAPLALGRCLEGLEVELYDLPRDPEARANVAAQHPDVVQRLEAQATALAKSALPQHLSRDELERNESTLAELGYFTSMSEDIEHARRKTTAELFDALRSTDALECLERYYAATVLVERRAELTPDQLETIKAILAKPQPAAVRSELEQLVS